ncbi:TolC family protein [Trinickia caryophylli]|nr:TolC family protein [Trinickia caryophylli]TRX20388.1 TolC family protein [Trinickia caryophylli]
MVAAGPRGDVCVFGALSAPLALPDAIERALCNHPKTRQAWADVKAAAAAVGVSRAAYLPGVTANWQGVRDETTTNIDGFPQFNSKYRNSLLRTDSISLSWVLYDFGGRRAALSNATALLVAARATEDATLQETFASVAKDYYAAQAAEGALAAAQEIERHASDSFKAATAKVDKGVAPISDQLQAQTSWADAVVNRTKAEGEYKNAVGTLAADMNLEPDTPLALPEVAEGVLPDAQFDESISELIGEAKRSHPSIAAAQAQLEASEAKVAQTKAQGMPTLSLVAKYSRNNQPTTLQIGQPQFATTGREWYLGLQLTIPLFEGFGRTYQVEQARAQAEHERDVLEEARRQVGLDVWISYQALQVAKVNVGNSAMLLDVAGRSYQAAQRRYDQGVGSILELLTTQSSLASAKRQRIQALTDWRSARLQLAAKLGRAGLWDVGKSP